MVKKDKDNINCEYIVSTINKINDNILQGYSHENFIAIKDLVNSIKKYIDKNELQTIEEEWRNSYTDSIDKNKLNNIISEICNRFSIVTF